MSYSEKELREAIHTMYNDQDPEPREFIVRTGEGGMRMFNEAMKRQVRLDSANRGVNSLEETNKITSEEAANLRAMIKSPDLENLTVVESVIEYHEQR